MRLPLIITLLVASAGCSTECQEPSRFSGRYEVFSSVSVRTPEEPEGMVTTAPFYNGLREWDLLYRPSTNSVQLVIDGQELEATFFEQSDNCNRFHLTITDGRFVADVTPLGAEDEVESIHHVNWDAQMIWQGVEMAGEYTVVDAWRLSTGESGSLEASGQISALLLDDE